VTEHRDGRTTDTRQLILKEAEKLYYVGGYERISLQVIADHLEISKAALFHHFKNKRELFFEMLLLILAHMRAMFEESIRGEGLSTRVKLYLTMQRLTQEPIFDVMRFQREEYILLEAQQQRIVNERWHSDMFDIMQGIFKVGVQQGELREHDIMLSTHLFLNMCILLPYANNPVHIEEGQAKQDMYITALLDMLLDGLNKK